MYVIIFIFVFFTDLFLIQSTGSLELGWRIFKARSRLYARTNMAAVTCRRSWRKVFLNIET